MSEENVEIVRRVFDASARRDARAVLALYDPDVEWDASRTQPGLGEFADISRGHDGLRRFFRAWREAWASDEYDYDELIDAGGETVISIGQQRGQGHASGLPATRTLAGVWTIREAKIVRAVWFATREEALEAAGLLE
jgi:ketosteroid isomerase-like protein